MINRTIKYVDDTGILEVRYAGEITYDDRIETLHQLERILPAGGFHRMLINYTSAWPAATARPGAIAEFGERLGRLVVTHGARVALVNAIWDVTLHASEGSRSGGFTFRQFQDRALAIEWLRESGEMDGG